MATMFRHPKGEVTREETTVRLTVIEDDGTRRVRQERTYETVQRADLAYWDAVDWLRKLRG
jgi:hypothetical protein